MRDKSGQKLAAQAAGFLAGWLLGFGTAFAVSRATGLDGDARSLSIIMTSTFVGAFVAAGVRWHQGYR